MIRDMQGASGSYLGLVLMECIHITMRRDDSDGATITANIFFTKNEHDKSRSPT